jgi:hypothetical protein
MFTAAIITALALTAAEDGFSTDYAIKRGNVEIDPIMVKIFGTNRPSLTMGIGLSVQAVFHLYESVHNYRSIH